MIQQNILCNNLYGQEFAMLGIMGEICNFVLEIVLLLAESINRFG